LTGDGELPATGAQSLGVARFVTRNIEEALYMAERIVDYVCTGAACSTDA